MTIFSKKETERYRQQASCRYRSIEVMTTLRAQRPENRGFTQQGQDMLFQTSHGANKTSHSVHRRGGGLSFLKKAVGAWISLSISIKYRDQKLVELYLNSSRYLHISFCFWNKCQVQTTLIPELPNINYNKQASVTTLSKYQQFSSAKPATTVPTYVSSVWMQGK